MFQTQKMETIGALAAGVAHDFNNLLLAIRGNVTLLLMEAPLGPEVRQRLERIDQAAEQAANITRQLLTFSRAADEQVTTLDLNQVVLEAGELARRILRKQVGLKLETASYPVKVRMDATRAQQMLLNLCVNAQDAMPEGGQVTITNAALALPSGQAERQRLAPGARYVRCSVADTGTGIPPAVLSRIFEPFFTTKEQGKGTGLGLAIVQNVVRQAGGFLEVDTEVGRGTTFHLYFPETKGDVSATSSAVAPAIPRGTGRILVVDDQDLVRDFAQKFLGAIGYEVLTADSAETALRIMEEQSKPLDLLLTDYSMPGMNGRELIAEVAGRWPGVRFILASGYLESGERDQITAQHGTRILHKPFDLVQAADLIARLLQRR
jgi:CheY-like chemotaxis protein